MANRINYNTAVSQADSIKDLSDDLGREITQLDNLLARIKNEWKGPASEEFQKRLRSMIADMKTTKSDMESVSSSIKTVARRIKREDDEANAQAASLGGGGGGSR